MSGAEALRFAGKIFGTQKDFWIAIGRLPQAEEDSKDATVEPRGKGLNETVFWVTDNLLNDWIQLPDCNPVHVQQAR
jgi:radial spoke head protein 4A